MVKLSIYCMYGSKKYSRLLVTTQDMPSNSQILNFCIWGANLTHVFISENQCSAVRGGKSGVAILLFMQRHGKPGKRLPALRGSFYEL